MIINYESAVEGIEKVISEYQGHPDFRAHPVWKHVVSGLNQALDALENERRMSGYSKAILGLDSDDLKNLKSCIEGKLRDIEKEEQFKLYRLTVDGLCSYYRTPAAAKSGLFEEFNNLDDDDFGAIDVEIDSIYVAKSDLPSYTIVE